ncbi:hemoglobin-like flavoprotein [Bacillus mesophilus]|uniref:Spore germination protein n=1 Tax=Bacillus mesophilus TaxID=1808955 RepID=A0A6M0QAW3_9BACI|nr:spore germination protein [Bacillus mesophilus]MBM7662865.1 hemoglobin-like flavoprotein [Bacillus mesophilus]NEY73455.1 spore germination protein [Bacillus mesophilus]
MRQFRNRYYKEWEKQAQGHNDPSIKTEFSEEITQNTNQPTTSATSLFAQFQKHFELTADLTTVTFKHLGMTIYYFDYLVVKEIFEQRVKDIRELKSDELENYLYRSSYNELTDYSKVEDSIFHGNAILFFQEKAYELPVKDGEARAVTSSDVESAIVGPHDSFVESISTNLSLIRRRIISSKLKAIKLVIGTISKKTVYLLYIEDHVSKEEVTLLEKRIASIKNDGILDTNMLVQLIDDNPHSPFPQFFVTERPDISVYKLFEGKIVGLIEDSPHAFCTPTGFLDFMETTDDFGQRWVVGTFIKLLRIAALLITIFFTPLYVSVTTHHYEMIPQALLPTLVESRSRVPFPPIIEALFLEFLLELLREAGARLPTKIGQTIGIVGGIVIGQAAVDAGITSNILIIVVAASAIASFVIPSYLMSASIRIVRFAFIIMAAVLGNIGIVFGFGLLVIHLTSITNLNYPYLMPLSPTRPLYWKYSLFRGAIKKNNKSETR